MSSFSQSTSARSDSISKSRSAVLFSALMLLSSYAALEFAAWEALASTDQDGDGLTYGLEFYINTQPQDWDTDNDGLPDGWEWQYGLNPLSPSGDNGSTGDPDGDSLSNLNEFMFGMPSNWDSTNTPNELDNGVWWNGTVPVSNWDEESAMQLIQGLGSDGADEDPWGNICFNTFDDDKDGMVDNFDADGDGDANCTSDDDDGDGAIDEDPNGWDTDGDGMPDGWEVANGLDPTSRTNQDGASGDPDGDGLVNLKEFVNPAWGTRNGTTTPPTQYFRPGPLSMTATESPCNPVLQLGPGGCQIFTAEVDGITSTDPQSNDTDGDGLNDSYEALILLTDPTSPDTDGDGIEDGVEVNGQYGDPPLASDPRNNNTDGDQFDDGEEDLNGNGVVDENETDPTRIEDSGDFDDDGIPNWEENMTCTLWNVADTDGGGISDGSELDPSHGTDPCTSLQTLNLSIVDFDSTNMILTLNETSSLDPTPEDWRQNGEPMGFYVSSTNGSLTGFRFTSINGDSLRGIDTDKPPDATTVLFVNFSWCWDQSLGLSNDPICDDDYFDTDGDGLADWEESTGSFGFLSDWNMSDTDGDGVNDLDEILNQTDPSNPCDNLLDTDGDGLNNYFENTTVCLVAFGSLGGNGTVDTYFTLWNESDTDNGGVTDLQEYLDGTNPQNNPNDDLNPVDTDGDGIPDTIENATGTDWRDPDTDGGGIPDGQECTSEFWDMNCLNADGDPWDPADDIDPNMMFFEAMNTSVGVDPNITHYWRWHTYDFYTGISWGVNTSLVGNTQMYPGFSTTQGVADQQFWDGSEVLGWEISLESGALIFPGEELIAPHNAVNYTGWTDANAGLNFSNFTRDVIVDGATIDTLFVTAPQVLITQAIRDNTTEFANSSYATDMPSEFLNRGNTAAFVNAITTTIINESGAFSAWDRVSAIQDFIINGNSTTTFLRNHNGTEVGLADGEDDLSFWILNNSLEGDCDQFSTLFAVMLRSAGIPARKVTGFSGGKWTGTSFEVYGKDFTSWVEVHLQTNSNLGDADLGWIPFEACPALSTVEVVEENWGPIWFDRDLSSGNLSLDGTLRFTENQSTVSNITIDMYLVKSNQTGNVPGSAAIEEHYIGTAITDSNGAFNITGQPQEVINPGYGSLVLRTYQNGYVGSQGISFPWKLNVTDNVSMSVNDPEPPDEPKIGIGVNTTITGDISLSSEPYNDITQLDSLQVVLNYTTSFDGPVSLISSVGAGGYYEFSVPIDESEQEGLISATLNFLGWHEEDLNNASTPLYHLRPSSVGFNLNLTPAPNLTVTLEGHGENNTILEIDQPIFLNGTVLSRSAIPEALNGTLTMQMRRSAANGPFTTLTSWYLNDSDWSGALGQFAVNWSFSAADVPVPAGLVEIRYQFEADGLFAKDEAVVREEHGVKSYINFSYILNPAPVGSDSEVEVTLSDHTGTSVASFLGEYTLDFNGELAWNQSDPELPRVMVTWRPTIDVEAGDYPWQLNYSGSTWLLPNSVLDTVRVQGRADVTHTLGSEWTPRGQSSWISGFARDINLNTTILGNNSSIIVNMEVPSEQPPTPDGLPAPPVTYRLGEQWIDNTTGEYNITFQMPSGVGAGVYDLRLILDFEKNPPSGGAYYLVPGAVVLQAGIQTEYVVESEPLQSIVIAGQTLVTNATITDVESSKRLQNTTVDMYFDWGGPLQQVLNSTVSGSDGVARFTSTIPADAPPGYYDVRLHAPDDLTDSLTTPDAGRWLGNESMVNLTVQVASSIRIDNAPLPEVTAGQFFQLQGQVLDGVDQNRSVSGPMTLEVFFLNDPSETLITGHVTSANGSFSVMVPTDPLGDGVTNGLKTVVVSVENGSTPFYLTGTGNETILVRGVTQLTDRNPILNTIVDRGTSISFGARLVESSDADRQLANMSVSALFHETWLNPEQSTNGQGIVNFTFSVPHSHPLGLIPIILMFNGSNGSDTLHTSSTIINTITVRSPTTISFDPITSNPAAGEFLDISGTLTSSNGSGIVDRSGNALNPTLNFAIDGDTNSFSVIGGTVDANGSWSARIFLDLSFPRGTHNITASYTPSVNYYGASSEDGTFDSRGFSMLSIISPADLDPDERVVRGDNITLNMSLIDNSGQFVSGGQIDVSIDGTQSWSGFTDESGILTTSIQTDENRAPGPMTITATFAGFNGSTGLLGDETWTRVVILAPSIIEVTSVTGSAVAGESVTFTGTLLDEHGAPLIENGEDKGGVVHLSIDGIDVGPLYTSISNASTGTWSITYDLPLNTDYGAHTFTVDFLGGFTWVDPMGQGDSLNPEYFLPSTITEQFNATQTSQVVLTTPPGEIDRNELLLIEGMLTDGAGRVLPGRELDVYMNDQFLTSLSVSDNGTFSLFFPVPPDMPLGPRNVRIEFSGEEFVIGSNSTTIFTVFGPVEVEIEEPNPVAVGDVLKLSGNVKDNLPNGWLENHSLQIFIDGILIGTTTTDENGLWSHSWVVSEFLDVGQHSLTVIAPDQGYHRQGSVEANLTIAYHTGMTLQVENNVVTRGGSWNLSGRLFDADSAGNPGLEGRELSFLLDGEVISTITTSIDGTFSISHELGYLISRGSHDVSLVFSGEQLYLANSVNATVYTRADVKIEILFLEDEVVRSDGNRPIRVLGRIIEIGGEGNTMEEMEISLYWGDSLRPNTKITWDETTGQFLVESNAISTMPPGIASMSLVVDPDSSRFLNGGEINFEVVIKVPVNFEFLPDELYLGIGESSLSGKVNVTATDRIEAIEGVSITARLVNETATHFTVVGVTDQNGIFTYQFESFHENHPLWDRDFWGELSVEFSSDSDLIDPIDAARLSQFAVVDVEYEPEAGASLMGPALTALTAILLIGLAVAGAMFVKRRKQAAIDELAGVFSYTAELLAAGDEIREAIFNCYEGLCQILMSRGFLRRDFETVREFELAIRKALPISEQALLSLDRIFEEARYSSHVLGEPHRESAQMALSAVLQEIDQLEEVPSRENSLVPQE